MLFLASDHSGCSLSVEKTLLYDMGLVYLVC